MSAKFITIQGFLHEFKLRDKELPDQRFCFIIGAGASVRSGIPSGAAMVKEWIEQLHIREDSQELSVAAWATSKNLGIDGFEYVKAASFYPQIFKRRFQDYPELGYAFLEAAMTDKEPSFGYSVLAQILAGTRHNVIITTNFDNLVVDALSFYCRKSPFVCGHESLTGFVRPQLKRPLIAKIHRDLLLEPINTPEGTAQLATGWVKALTELLRYYTPIVIGYGGNDGSSEIESRFKERLAAYRNQFEALLTEIQARGKDVAAEKAKEPVRQAAAAAVERITKEKDWWAWELKARQKTDPAEKEAVYREGLKDFPDSPQLLGNFALFMHEVRKNYDEAERLYRKALELDPNRANNTLFMHQVRKNYDEAERLYRKALELDPSHANNTGNFALFIENVRKNYDEAERFYRKALELDPAKATTTGNFADFMEKVRKNYDEAERLYRKALELDPANEFARKHYESLKKDRETR